MEEEKKEEEEEEEKEEAGMQELALLLFSFFLPCFYGEVMGVRDWTIKKKVEEVERGLIFFFCFGWLL